MDYFSVLFESVCLLAQSAIQLIFISRLLGQKYKIWYFLLYPSFLFILGFAAVQSTIINTVVIGIQLILLFAISYVVLKTKCSVSFLSATIAIYISQLSFGMINSIESIIFPRFVETSLLYLLLTLATVAAFAICICFYVVVLKLLSLKENDQTPYITLLLLPGLFFFLAELYILHMSYSQVSSTLSLTEAGKHVGLLLIQGIGLAALFCTLYAYRRICSGFQAQSALDSLTQAAQAQKIYISEARMRYEQTKAFRHDIKNHLLLLDGLLRNGQIAESREYLKKLEGISTSLSFSYQIGNPVVDILLSEKLGLAQANGIQTDVSLILPKVCRIDDLDLCIIFANALDNALKVCLSIAGTSSINISGKQQGDFYMLEFQNTCCDELSPQIGTGLSNIKSVAEKYHGAMLIETHDKKFSLNVLLNISLPADNSSRQSY